MMKSTVRDVLGIYLGMGLCLWSGCGGTSHYEDQGECAAPAGSTEVKLDPYWTPQFSGSCVLPIGSQRTAAFERFTSLAEFNARIDVQSCPILSAEKVDFSVDEVLLIGGYSNEIGGVDVQFVAEDATTRYLGLKGRPVGFPLPDFLRKLPASPKPITQLSCRQVCTSNCDEAIP